MEQSALRPIFQSIYEKQQWGKGSGPGSSPENTEEYRGFLQKFIKANHIRTVTDLGCGDWQFSHLIDWSNVDYLGLDIVPEVITENRNRFASPNRRFEELTSIADLPGGDLLLSKEVLQHLPNRVITEYLAAIGRKYRFALLTNGAEGGPHTNSDITPGDYRPLQLHDAPFNAPGAVVFNYSFPGEQGGWFTLDVFLMVGSI